MSGARAQGHNGTTAQRRNGESGIKGELFRYAAFGTSKTARPQDCRTD
jgi:hypothetical protein